MLGEEQSRNDSPCAPRDLLVTELAKAESDLERIETQRTAANARIAALRNELAAHDATPRSLAPEPLSGLAPRTPADKVKLFRQLFRGCPDLYPTRFVNKKTGKPGYAPACSNKFVPGVCELPKVKCGDGAFNPSSQHFLIGGVDEYGEAESRSSRTCKDAIAWATAGVASVGAAAVLAGDRRRVLERRSSAHSWSVAGGWFEMVSGVWRYAAIASFAVVAANIRTILVAGRA